MGDPGGIGPEIAVKAALDKRVRAICEPVIVGAKDALEAHCGSLKKLRLVETAPREFHIGEMHPEHGLAALDAARAAIQGAMAGHYHAVVAAPHSETAIHAAGIEFDGYPSFVARTAGLAPEDGILMLCFEHAGREVRIAHVTLHASVRQGAGDDYDRAGAKDDSSGGHRLGENGRGESKDRRRRRQSPRRRRRPVRQ